MNLNRCERARDVSATANLNWPSAGRMRAACQNHSLLLPVDSNLKRQRNTLIFNPLAHLRDRDLSEDSSTVVPRISSRLIESSLLVL